MDAQRLVDELQRLRESQALLRKHLSKRLEQFPVDLRKELNETLGVSDFALREGVGSVNSGRLGDALTCLIAAAGAVGVSAGILAALGNEGTLDVMRSYTARLGAKAANASIVEARNIVRELWFDLSERERATRGAVLSFATRIAPKVKGTSVGGIKKWVAEFRKESLSR